MVDEPRTPQPAPGRVPPAQTDEQRRHAEQSERERKDRLQKDDDERRKRQEENNKKAADVMEKSTPYPTPEQVDKAKLGILNPDDVHAPDQPEMPPLHEQRADDKAKRR